MRFPPQQPGVLYLTEGGAETEIMYKFGHELPEFAMFTLLDQPDAMKAVRGMYERYLDVAARYGFVALMGGLDYRASPDWAGRLGYSPAALADAQLRAIDFLRDVARPYETHLPGLMIVGVVGPRGDAYALNQSITPEDAEAYHRAQLDTLREAQVDLVSALTFNNVPETVGLSRAAHAAGLPLAVSFTLDATGRLKSGPSVREAIQAVDAHVGEARPAFYGINCSHPDEFEAALEPGDWIQRLRSLRPNASRMDKIELCTIGHLESGDPPELGRELGALSRRYPHIDIWGGCCGTWDTHLDEIARNVHEARRPS